MKRVGSLFIALFVVAKISPAHAWGDVEQIEVGKREVPYRVSDGTNTQTGTVKYHLYLTRQIIEEGRPSTFDHPIDDRRCRWTINSHMQREVCFNSIAGGQSCNNNMKKDLPFSLSGTNGQPSGIFDHRPCTDAVGEIGPNTNSIVKSIRINAITNEDLSGDLADTMKGRGATITYGK